MGPLEELSRHRVDEAIRTLQTYAPLATRAPVDKRQAAAFAKFSLGRAIQEAATDAGLRDGLEREAVADWARQGDMHYSTHRFPIAWDALASRDLTVASPSGGGYLKATDTLDPLDMLRPWSPTARAGVTILPGLKGNVVIPRTTGNVTRTWLSDEATGASVSTPTVGQLALVPHAVSGVVSISRLSTLQIPSVEAFLRREFTRSSAQTLDVVTLAGTGAEQPLGIVNTSGIGTQSGTSLAWSGILAMQRSVEEANADDAAVAFIATPAVKALLSGREKASGSASSGPMDGWPASPHMRRSVPRPGDCSAATGPRASSDCGAPASRSR